MKRDIDTFQFFLESTQKIKGGPQASFSHMTAQKIMKNKNVKKGLLVFLAKRKEILKQTLHQILDSTRGHHLQRKN